MALSKIEADSLNIGQVGGRRNLIINGAMQVAQRGTSSANYSNGTYVCDRFTGFANGLGASGTVQTGEQSTEAPAGFKKSFKLTVTTAGGLDSADNYFGIGTKLEHQDISHLMDQNEMTLSFWVKSSLATTYGIVAQRFDQAGQTSGRNTYVSTYTINVANTWERKTITIPTDTTTSGETDNAQGLILAWVMDVTSGGTRDDAVLGWNDSSATIQVHSSAADTGFYNATNNWAITGVQLEVGDTATPFEHRSYGEELVLCQRYYEKSYNHGTDPGTSSTNPGRILFMFGNSTSGYVGGHVNFAVNKRATPTITTYAPNAGTSGQGSFYTFGSSTANASISSSDPNETGFDVYKTGQTCDSLAIHFAADAEL